MKTLIVFYSYGHHTKDVAEKMAAILSCDIAEILPVKLYTGIYQDLVDETENNRNTQKTPAIKNLKADVKTYDRIIIGTPVWWYTMAEPVRTFLKENDNGITVVEKIFTMVSPFSLLKTGEIGITLKEINVYGHFIPLQNGIFFVQIVLIMIILAITYLVEKGRRAIR